jgi:hypothetical protein
VALGILTARSGARVGTFIAYTSFVGRTIGVQDAFGSASFVGVTDIVGQACTRSSSISFFANGVSATR